MAIAKLPLPPTKPFYDCIKKPFFHFQKFSYIGFLTCRNAQDMYTMRDAMVKIEMSKRLDFMLRALHESFSVLFLKRFTKSQGAKLVLIVEIFIQSNFKSK